MKKWTWQGIMAVIGTILLLIYGVGLLTGCNGAEKRAPAPQYKPLNTLIMSAPQQWKDAYGDTLETQLVFNAAVGRQDDRILQNGLIQTAGVIKNAHAADPNEAEWRESIEARFDVLESDAVKYSDAVRFHEYGTDEYWGYQCGQIVKLDPNNLPPEPEKYKQLREDWENGKTILATDKRPYLYKHPKTGHLTCSKHGDREPNAELGVLYITSVVTWDSGVNYCRECYWEAQENLTAEHTIGLKEK